MCIVVYAETGKESTFCGKTTDPFLLCMMAGSREEFSWVRLKWESAVSRRPLGQTQI